MPNGFLVVKEVGDVQVVPELKELSTRFNTDMTVRGFKRPEYVNNLEWAIPAAVALFLAKPFFEEMMKALGKSTGEGIISAIKKQFAEGKKHGSRVYSGEDVREIIKAGDTPAGDKLRKTLGRPHPSFELRVEYTQTETFRFVLRADMDENDIPKALAELADRWEEDVRVNTEKYNETIKLYGHAALEDTSVYVPSQGRWMGMAEILTAMRNNEKL
jgi:hypothetical protein